MRKNRKRIRKIWMALLTATVLLFGTCITAGATESTGNAGGDESSSDVKAATAGNLDLTKEGYIQIRPKYNGTYLTDGTFAIYRVADVDFEDGNMTYVITDEFAGSGMGDRLTREALTDDEGILKDAELIDTLRDYALDNGIAPVREDEVTEEAHGWIRFRDVTAGLYMVVQTVDSTGFETAEPFLVTYPMVGSDGAWDYYVDVTTKMDLIPITEEGYTELSVTKVWRDDNNADGVRPAQIEVSLIADGLETDQMAVLSEENDWTYTFTDLPLLDEYGRDIVYSVDETVVPEGYEERLTGDSVNGYVITNMHEGEITEYTEVPVTKAWVDDDDADGIRPGDITVNLVANGEATGQTAVLSEDNGWSYTFVNLPLCDEDGIEIAYTVDETAVPEGYEESLAGDAAGGYVITNTHEVEQYVEIPVTKVWVDDDDAAGIRPVTIMVDLLADGEATDQTAVLSDDNGWTYTFTNLPLCDEDGTEITYTVDETAVPEGYTESLTGDVINGFVITNTIEGEIPEYTEIPVTKVWYDNDDEFGMRPEEVSVVLLADGVPTEQTAVLSEENGWTYTFANLDIYAEDGSEITYWVDEISLPEGYTYDVTEEEGTGLVITNTFVYELEDYTEIPVIKVWDDDDDAKGERPESVEVVLLLEGEETDLTGVLSEENDWSYTFYGLAKYGVDGEELTYGVTEVDVPDGYYMNVSWDDEKGFVVTNTYGTGKTASSGGSGGSTKLPQTGQLNWPIPLLAAGGIFLFILGWAFNRSGRRREKSAN